MTLARSTIRLAVTLAWAAPIVAAGTIAGWALDHYARREVDRAVAAWPHAWADPGP